MQEEISRLRDELDAERDAREDALGEQDDLRAQLRELQNQLDEAIDQRDHHSNSNSVSVGDGRRGRDKEGRRELERLERKIGDLEQVRPPPAPLPESSWEKKLMRVDEQEKASLRPGTWKTICTASC